MKVLKLSFLVLLFFAINTATAAGFTVKRNLANDWLTYQNDKYTYFTDGEEEVNTIYFNIDADKYGGDYFHIDTQIPYYLFINGLFAGNSGSRFNIDSLKKIYTSNLQIGIHQKAILKNALATSIETPVIEQLSINNPIQKPSTFFRDFVVIALMGILSLLIVIIRLNPKLAADYFSVTKIFSQRESDDSQIYTRISSSTNILFYVFCSLILSFYMMVVFHFIPSNYPIANYFQSSDFATSIGNWLKLSMIVLGMFVLKIILVYTTSILFASKEIAGIHFFNWVRLLLIVFGTLSAILFFYFILHGQSIGFHILLLRLIAWALAGWAILIFLKLNGRGGYSVFHLFSYICATEIIPLLIIVSVLYH